LAGLLVQFFRTVGAGFLTVMLGAEIVTNGPVRTVNVGGFLAGAPVACLIALMSGANNGFNFFMAAIGGGLAGAFLAFTCLFFTDSSMK
jgi:hypothetical protein